MDFTEVISKRKSVRKFSDTPVERDMLDAIVAIARTAPSSRGSKSSEFLIIEDKDTITMDSTFVDDLGADSLDVFQIIMGIEETFDIEIDNDDAEKITTVGDAVEQIKNATND